MGTDLEGKCGTVLRFGGARLQWRRKYSSRRPTGGYRSSDEGRQSHSPGFTERSCRFDLGEGSTKRLGYQSEMMCLRVTKVKEAVAWESRRFWRCSETDCTSWG